MAFYFGMLFAAEKANERRTYAFLFLLSFDQRCKRWIGIVSERVLVCEHSKGTVVFSIDDKSNCVTEESLERDEKKKEKNLIYKLWLFMW